MVWLSEWQGLLYCQGEPEVRIIEVDRPNGLKVSTHKLSFWGTNSLVYARHRKDLGIRVGLWSDQFPWQMQKLHPSGTTLFLITGEFQSYRRKSDGARIYGINARLLMPMNTGSEVQDPEIMRVRKSAFMHLHAFAKQHGYSPLRHVRLNRGGSRNEQPDAEPEDLEPFLPPTAASDAARDIDEDEDLSPHRNGHGP